MPLLFNIKLTAIIFAGMAKRPMGFPTPNFVQGQVSANAPGATVGGANQQLQSSQAITHTGKFGKEKKGLFL